MKTLEETHKLELKLKLKLKEKKQRKQKCIVRIPYTIYKYKHVRSNNTFLAFRLNPY